MAFETISCPYCNTQFSAADQELFGEGIACPRCGERIPQRGGSNPDERIPRGAEPVGVAGSRRFENPAGRSNRKVAEVILTVMILMAVIALWFALQTQKARRDRDVLGLAAPPPEQAPLQKVAPYLLPGLRYLPGDCNVVAGVHVREALQEPAAKDFLKRSPLTSWLDRLEKWAGLELEDLDSVVIGIKVDGEGLRIILAAETTRAVDEAKVRAAVKSSSLPEVSLLFPSDRTLIVTYPRKEEKTIRLPPNREPDLPHPLGAWLLTGMETGTVMWVMGHAERWDQPLVKLLLADVPKERQEVLAKVQTFSFGLQFDDQVTLAGTFECTDEKTAQALAASLDQWKKEGIVLWQGQSENMAFMKAKGKVDAILQALDRSPVRLDKP